MVNRYTKRVEEIYRAYLAKEIPLPDAELWDFAKEVAEFERVLNAAAKKAKQQGRDEVEVFVEDYEKRMRQKVN